METHARIYDSILKEHFATERQMAFLSGPRQVGKTTTSQTLSGRYLNWDNADDRQILLAGPKALASALGLDALQEEPPIIVLDEIHKFTRWKSFLKGFFDTYQKRVKIIVTGSARLDVFRRGGDSLMGRYFLYRVHPLSVGEILRTDVSESPIRPPKKIADAEWDALWTHGGFPEPFWRRDVRFSRRWRLRRNELLVREDLREVSQVQNLGPIEMLMQMLALRSGGQLVVSNIANELGVAPDTIKQWVDLLERLHYGFLVRPWFKNVTKALRKEPKWFLRDWSGIEDIGARAETFVACHLLKSVEGWTDLGLGHFELRYLRDKLKREVDFLVVRDGKPWFLVEVKAADTTLSRSLSYFQEATNAPHAFQVVVDMPFVKADCFAEKTPLVVPARTLFSQLL